MAARRGSCCALLREQGIEVVSPTKYGSREGSQLNAKYLEIADSDGLGPTTSDGEDFPEPTTGRALPTPKSHPASG